MMHETITAAPSPVDMDAINRAYYESEGGRRVTQGGIPCKVYSRPRSKETREVIDRLALAIAGECDWTPHPDLPGFTFAPADKANATTKAPKASAGPSVPVKYDRSYYADGYRVVIDGVPCKVASKPTKNRMALLRQNHAFAPISDKIGKYEPDSDYDAGSDARFSAKRCEARYAAAIEEMRAAMVEAPSVQPDMMDAPATPIVGIAEPAPVVEQAERPRIRLRLVQGEVCPPAVETVDAVGAPAVEPEAAPVVEMKRYTVAAWKRDLALGSHWRKVQIDPNGTEHVSPMVRTVALVRSREVGFVHGLDAPTVTPGSRNKGLAWQGFPQAKHGQSIAICERGVTLQHGRGYATRYEPIDRATAEAMIADLSGPTVAIGALAPVQPEPSAVETPPAAEPLTSTESADMPTNTAETSTAALADDSAALLARIAKLESIVDDLMVIALREAPALATPDHGNDAPVPLPSDPRARAVVTARDARTATMSDHAKAKRLRIVRRYLAMRAERQALGVWIAEQLELLERTGRRVVHEQRKRRAVARIARARHTHAAYVRDHEAAMARADDVAQARAVQLNRDVALWKGRAIEAGYRERSGIAALMSPRPVAKPAPVASGSIIMLVSAGGGARQ